MKKIFDDFLIEILGVKIEKQVNSTDIDGLMDLIIDIRAKAKAGKDFATSDKIRDVLNAMGISIKDGKEGTDWSKN